MRVTGGSDLARMQALQKQALATRNRLDTAATEMTTNLKASRFEATGGNLTRLFALERSLDRNKVFTDNITLTELRLEVTQGSLGQILAPLQDLSIDMIDATCAGGLFDGHAARDDGAQRVRHHGRTAQRPGRRAVAFRRHHDRQPGAGAGQRDAGRSRRAGGGRRRLDRGDRGDRRLLRQAGRAPSTPPATSGRPTT